MLRPWVRTLARMPIRDDRRRRLLTNEELLVGESAREADAAQASSVPRRLTRYAKAADMSQQPRITDLIPRRPLLLCLWCMLGLSMIAGLETLYFWMPQVARATRDGRVAAFDLDGEGSLGAWFTSLMLGTAALYALLIYSLRRHRMDDYRGGYRIWLWASACFFVMSVDEAGSLHEGFKELMAHLTHNRLAYDPVGDGSLWWVIAYGAVLAPLGLLILWDMSETWVAPLSALATGGCYAAAVATQLGYILPERGARGVMLEEGCEMLGAMCLLFSLVTFAGHLVREIESGRGRKRRATGGKKRKTRSAARSSSKSSESKLAATASSIEANVSGGKSSSGAPIRKDAPHTSPASPAGKPATVPAGKGKR